MEEELSPIKYTSGGRLGDFVNQLSVINENYIKTGRKGILYIGFTGDSFSNKIKGTYLDTYKIIKSQPYIYDYKIHSGEYCDCDLSLWRNYLNMGNLKDIFSKTYNVEWGKNKWLYLEKNQEYKEKWKDIVLINTTKRRFKGELNYQELYDIYKDKMVFISSVNEDYEYFVKTTGINIENYKPFSFEDLCLCIDNCYMFVGGLSMPLTIGYSLHKNLLIACNNEGLTLEEKHNSKFNELWENTKYLRKYYS
jgi:hypothetical protein